MLHQFLFILTSTRQPTSVVLATDTALFSRAVLAHSTNPRDTSPQARFQHSPIAQRATHVRRVTQSGQTKHSRSMHVASNQDSNITAAPGKHTQMWASSPDQ